LDVLDVKQPHEGLGPPSAPKAVFFARAGGGPGFGRVGGVGGLELGIGPRWGRAALAFTGSLGVGFPIGMEGRYRWLNRGSFHATSTLGYVGWFLPRGFGQGLRTGLELGLRMNDPVFGWSSESWALGVYARGGPIAYSHATGGEVDFGVILGGF